MQENQDSEREQEVHIDKERPEEGNILQGIREGICHEERQEVIRKNKPAGTCIYRQ